jgi:hypothetical protein
MLCCGCGERQPTLSLPATCVEVSCGNNRRAGGLIRCSCVEVLRLLREYSRLVLRAVSLLWFFCMQGLA